MSPESNPEEAARIKAQADSDKAAGIGVHDDGSHPIADYTFAHGGSYTGPTCDIDGNPLAEGDKVVFVANHHADWQLWPFYKDAHGVVHQVQDVFPFAQVLIEFPTEPRLTPVSTFSINVRKES